MATGQQGPDRYQASSLLVGSRPNEMGFPLREDEFQILCEAEISEAKARRDWYLGAFVGGVVGLAGLLAVVDWETSLKLEHRRSFLLWLAILLVIVAGSLVGGLIYETRLRRATSNSPYSRLKKRITDWFDQARTGQTIPQPTLKIIQARYGSPINSIDISKRLAELVDTSGLRALVTNELAGDDPHPGVAKELIVEYEYSGEKARKRVIEGNILTIP